MDSILWNFGDGNTSFLSNPSHSYNDPGEYAVQLIGYSPCSGDTMTQNIIIEMPFGGIEQYQGGPNYVTKRISENTYNLSSLNQNRIEKIEILDIMGRTIKANLNVLNAYSVNIELTHKGQILVRFELNGTPQLLRIYH